MAKEMGKHSAMAVCFLYAAVWSIPAAGQSTKDEFWPELGIYVQQGPLVRVEFVAAASSDPSPYHWQGDFTLYVQVALKPVLRPELRDRPDVFRNKYLTFRSGFRYRSSLTNGDNGSEKRGIVELTPRYLLPGRLVISDRNRGEFRFVKGEPFSTRYRNRLRLERDFKYGWLDCTPYAYDEVFFDTRYDRWTPNRYAFGVEFPAGPHIVLEPYYLRQNSRSNSPELNVLGFKLNLYL
jgi:hypothetical protein